MPELARMSSKKQQENRPILARNLFLGAVLVEMVLVQVVLFSALVAPLVSAAIAIIALVAFAIYEYRSPD